MNISTYSYEEYVHLVESFHGRLKPGLLVGGFIVDLAQRNLPEGKYFNAICETPVCLPDAVQLLTPCTVGNGWLKILDLGRFAVTLYEKLSGAGVRAYLDTGKLEAWPVIKSWYYKSDPQQEFDYQLLMNRIKDAAHEILSLQSVRVEPEKLRRPRLGPGAVCPVCGELYPVRDGEICLGCRGGSPYIEIALLQRPSGRKAS